MKALVFVIACDTNQPYPDATPNDPVYTELQKVWRSYIHLDPEHVEVYFLKSDPYLTEPFKIEGDTIWCQGAETWIPGILNKTLVAMEAMLPRLHEFDYVVRTNLSSFYVFPRLLKFLETLPKEKCYCGSIFGHYGWTLASGCGMILSPDLVELLVKNKGILYNQREIDDVIIGVFLSRQGIPLLNAPRSDFVNIGIWNANKDIIPEYAFHFRTKNPIGLRMTDELFIQHELLKMFYFQD